MGIFEYHDPILGLAKTPAPPQRHKVFVSYHHANDQGYKDELIRFGNATHDFISKSVDDGDIDPSNKTETIRRTIRDNHLRDSTVTIVLVGTETRNRKHVDWEIYSSMHDGQKSKKNGIVAITLPGTGEPEYYPNTKEAIEKYGAERARMRLASEIDYSMLGKRLVANLSNGKVWVLKWQRFVDDPSRLAQVIESAWRNRESAKYDMSIPPMGRNR